MTTILDFNDLCKITEEHNSIRCLEKCLDMLRELCAAHAQAIVNEYLFRQVVRNEAEESKNRGYVKVRVRKRVINGSLNISIEWYKQNYNKYNGKTYSQAINKGKSTIALLNNIKRYAKQWEMELAIVAVKALEDVQSILTQTTKMKRHITVLKKMTDLSIYDFNNYRVVQDDRRIFMYETPEIYEV